MKGKKAVHILSTALALALVLPQAAGAIGLEEARTLLRENYIDEIPEEILALPTIDEITDAIGDPYTYYMTAEEYEQFQTDLNGAEVVGIGVMVEKKVDGLEVIGIAPDAPAHGVLETGDLIVAADGVTLEEAGTPDALAALIAGEEGTSVTLTVLRDGESHRFTFVREQVVYPTVTGEVVDGHIGWLDCNSFGEDTGDYFETYITEEDPEADRWVVDLRGNPGGSATAVGICQRAIDECVKYAKERICFGKPIAKLQAIQFMLADMEIGVETARQMVIHTLQLAEAHQPYSKEAAVAKCYAGDVAFKVAGDAVQILGGYGYSREYPVEKLLRDSKILQIYEGTNQVQRVVIAGQLLR